MPKSPSVRRKQRQNPLEKDILGTGILRNKPAKRKERDDDDDGASRYVDSKASRNILRIGRELVAEDEASRDAGVAAAEAREAAGSSFAIGSRFDVDLGDGDDDGNRNSKNNNNNNNNNNNSGDGDGNDDAAVEWEDEDDAIDEAEVDPDDLEMYRKFMRGDEDDPLLAHGWSQRPPPGTATADGAEGPGDGEGEGTNLADLILQKITQFEQKQSGRGGDADEMDDEAPELPPKVVEVYTQVGAILSRYKSGRLPKPFKVLPQIPRWEEIIQLCNPHEWSPNACYQATRLFVASKPIVVQRFLEFVLLDKVRGDIAANKRLNVHLFNCLRRSLFRPAAFFKGFLFPLAASGSCTLREAHIVSGALNRVRVPVLHSAAALKGLCDIAAEQTSSSIAGRGGSGAENAGATNVLIHTLLAKRYALPYQVIDALVFHFLRFRSVDPASVREVEATDAAGLRSVGLDDGHDGPAKFSKLPLIWHQCLLEFARRYKNDITEDQREALLDLLQTHGHHGIAPEVRRELLAGRGRGVPEVVVKGRLDGDDTMLVD